MSWMCPVAMNAQRGQRESPHYKARIGQNCRAMCTKKSGLNSSGHSYALLNVWHESAVRFERPAEQALALATEPSAHAHGTNGQ